LYACVCFRPGPRRAAPARADPERRRSYCLIVSGARGCCRSTMDATRLRLCDDGRCRAAVCDGRERLSDIFAKTSLSHTNAKARLIPKLPSLCRVTSAVDRQHPLALEAIGRYDRRRSGSARAGAARRGPGRARFGTS